MINLRLDCRSGISPFTLLVEFDLCTAIAIIGNLQLALRHPANVGASAEIARELIDGMIHRMREAGLTAHAELARLGDDAMYDE